MELSLCDGSFYFDDSGRKKFTCSICSCSAYSTSEDLLILPCCGRPSCDSCIKQWLSRTVVNGSSTPRCLACNSKIKFSQDKMFEFVLSKAKEGKSWAQNNVGCFLFKYGGEGAEEGSHQIEAARWFSLSCRQNFPNSQYNLACLNYLGKGVEQNYMKAVHLFKLSALQGHIPSYYNLGICYLDGLGVEQSLFYSLYWLRGARVENYPSAVEILNSLEIVVKRKCANSLCDRSSGDMLPLLCRGCLANYYCCESCQAIDWNMKHKNECSPPIQSKAKVESDLAWKAVKITQARILEYKKDDKKKDMFLTSSGSSSSITRDGNKNNKDQSEEEKKEVDEIEEKTKTGKANAPVSKSSNNKKKGAAANVKRKLFDESKENGKGKKELDKKKGKGKAKNEEKNDDGDDDEEDDDDEEEEEEDEEDK